MDALAATIEIESWCYYIFLFQIYWVVTEIQTKASMAHRLRRTQFWLQVSTSTRKTNLNLNTLMPQYQIKINGLEWNPA